MQNRRQVRPIDQRLVDVARILPHQISLVRLSKKQLRVLSEIKRGEVVCSKDIADRCGLSLSSASTTLKHLWEKSYITRRANTATAGGVEYVYFKSLR